MSRLTMQVPGDDHVLEQVTKQLNKLIDVIKVTDLTRERFLNRECVLVKVTSTRHTRSELIALAGVFGGQILSVQSDAVVIQMIGEKIIREVAWDVVPETAERVVRERLAEIEKG